MSKLNEINEIINEYKRIVIINEHKRIVRIAVIWYLVLAIGTGYTWFYIIKTFVRESAVLTVQNILATETQYITAILFNIVGQIGFLFIAFTLYRLFQSFSRTEARSMLNLAKVSVTFSFVNIILQTGALDLLKIASYSTAFTAEQIYEFTTEFLRFTIFGIFAVTTSWFLWFASFIVLVYRYNLFPRIIANFIVYSGLCYMIVSIIFIYYARQ